MWAMPHSVHGIAARSAGHPLGLVASGPVSIVKHWNNTQPVHRADRAIKRLRNFRRQLHPYCIINMGIYLIINVSRWFEERRLIATHIAGCGRPRGWSGNVQQIRSIASITSQNCLTLVAVWISSHYPRTHIHVEYSVNNNYWNLHKGKLI